FVIGIAIGIASYSTLIIFKEKLKIDDALDVSSVHGTAGIIGALAIGIFASSAVNPAGPNGLLFGHAEQLGIQAIGVGVAGALGFGGTFIIMKVLDFLVGVRVSPEVEDAGLDISEHAERAYADEEEFKLEMDEYVKGLEERDEFFFNKK
ncbi:MAG: ammonia channel protein, partial [Candidatus Nitrosomaritimum yanchengensis]